MVAQITANELKVKGITAIDELVPANDGVIITVRGKDKYIVLSIEEYNLMRELELDAAIQDARRDIAEGKYSTGSISDHLKRITDV